MIDIFLFLLGFVLVVKGADLLIDGSVYIAEKLNVSEMAIGLTIVAFGTSLPELFVNISASFQSASDLAIGNVLGSNIANVLLVLGVAAIICPIPVRKVSLTTDIPFSLFAVFLMVFLANTAFFSGGNGMSLSKTEGIIMLLFFGFYMLYVILNAKKWTHVYDKGIKQLGTAVSSLYIILGIIGLYLGGEWIVNGAVYISHILDLSESFIGLSAVAVGTTVPELATAVTAAKKGSLDIAVGNVIGSNVFNLLWVLPVSALINPIMYDAGYNIDVLIIVVSGILLLLFAFIGHKKVIGRGGGIIFLLFYLCYLVYIYIRG